MVNRFPAGVSYSRLALTVALLSCTLWLSIGAQGAAASVPPKARRAAALFGTYPGYNDALNPIFQITAGPDLSASDYLPAMVAWQGRNNDVINFYDAVGNSTDQSSDATFTSILPAIWNTYRSIPMVSLNTQNWSNAQIIAGDADPALRAWATQLKGFIDGPSPGGRPAPHGGRRVYIRLDWEANAFWYNWAAGYGTTTCAALELAEQQYVEMWRHVYDVVMSTGDFDRSQVAWVFSVYSVDATFATGCANGIDNVAQQIYPGDRYVNWVGIDGYGYFASPQPAQEFGPMVSELRAIARKPVSIDEVGAWTRSGGGTPGATTQAKGQWIANYFSYLQTAGIKMSLSFNIDLDYGAEQDWAVFSQPDAQDPVSAGDCSYTYGGVTYNAYCEYAAGVRSPYFVSPNPHNPRLLSTNLFLGVSRDSSGSAARR